LAIQRSLTQFSVPLRLNSHPALRRVASVSAVDLVAALLAANSRLKEVGLQVRVTGGMVSLWAGP